MKTASILSFFTILALTSATALDGVVHQEDLPDFRSFDGTGNAENDAGAANTPQLRIRRRGPGPNGRPNPRAISNAVMAQNGSTPNERGMSELVTFFGQFIDHNVVLTPMSGPQLPISVPDDDDVLEVEEIPFRRSPQVQGSPVNVITSFIDGSAIYGSSEERATALRTGRGGALKTGDRNLLPNNDDGIENEPDESARFFVAGDLRVNENLNLMVMHTLFVREHNIIARELRRAFRNFDDEELFQTARLINTAQLQKIVYNEWLPALLGDDTDIPEFDGFNSDIEPVVSAFFSTAAFRVGHTLLNDNVTRINRRGRNNNIPLRDTFMTPELIRERGVDDFVRGMANTPAQEVDTMIVDGVRNFLFTNIAEEFPDVEGIDLAARNIQRARDHRIPTYNQARSALGLRPRRSFEEVSSDPTVSAALESVYRDVNQIDGFVGALAEDRVDGSSFGELLRASWSQEFTRLRDGDRFFYLNEGQFSEELRDLPRVQNIFDDSVSTMRQIVLETTRVRSTEIPENVFFSN